MVESFLVYSILTIFMVCCGIYTAQTAPRYVGYSGIYKNQSFFSIPSVLLFLSFAFVFGCRWDVGVDYPHYLYVYLHGGGERHEMLFHWVQLLFVDFGFHYAFFFGFWAFLDIVGLFYCVKKYKFLFPFLALMLMLTSLYLSMMNTMRQHAAIAVFLISLRYIDDKKLFKYCGGILIAFLLHKSAIILIALYLIFAIRKDWFKNIKLQLLLYSVCFILQFYFSTVIEWIEAPFTWLSDSLDYDRYNMDMLLDDRWSRDKFGRNTGFGVYANILRVIPVILYSTKMKAYYKSSYFEILYSLWFIGVLLSLLFGSSIILNRIVMYFTHFSPIIYSFFLYYCFRTKKVIDYLVGCIIVLIFIALFVNIVTNPISTAQYSFFWEH